MSMVSKCGGRWPLASLLLKRYLQRSRNIQVPNAALSAWHEEESWLQKRGEWPWALLLLSDLPRRQMQCDTVACNAALSVCPDQQWPAGVQLLRTLKSRTLQGTSITYTSAAVGEWAQATHLLEEVQVLGIQKSLILENSVTSLSNASLVL
ncbi:unnamed protein product [Effrenium voratum]|nr:unnamed protein product [Effrenium voratum]